MKTLYTTFLVLFAFCFTIHAEDELTKEPNSVYICTFNVYKLGAVAQKYLPLEDEDDGEPSSVWGTPERIKNLASVLAYGKFDLIVLQELREGSRGDWALSDLAQELEDTHGLKYSHFMSDHIGKGLIPEAMGFLYNAAIIKPESTAGQPDLAENIEIPGRHLVMTRWVAGDFDFTLVSCHLAWGNEEHRDEGFKKVQEILTTPTPSQFSDDPDIIVLGDFNRFGAGYESVKNMEYDPEKYLAPNITFFDPKLTHRKNVTKKSIEGKGVPDDNPQFVSTTVAKNRRVYDIIFITKDCDEEYPGDADTSVYGKDFGIVCFDEKGGPGYSEEAGKIDGHDKLKIAYSDHRPLWMRLSTDAGERDRVEAEAKYVGTEGGRKFHRPGCRTIRGRAVPRKWTTPKEALVERGPCRVCKP